MVPDPETLEMNNNEPDPESSEMNNNEPSTSDKVPSKDFDSDGVDYSRHFTTSEIFRTDSEAIDWAKKTAIRHGFELGIASHKKGGREKLLRCSRGGRYRGAAIRKNTKTKVCKCNFQIRARQLKGSTSWGIRAFSGTRGMHNHALAVYPEGYRQIRGLDPVSKKIVRDLSLAQAKPLAILTAIQEKNSEDNLTRKHVYKYREYLKRVGLESKDVVAQFSRLAVENKYVHWTRNDPNIDEDLQNGMNQLGIQGDDDDQVWGEEDELVWEDIDFVMPTPVEELLAPFREEGPVLLIPKVEAQSPIRMPPQDGEIQDWDNLQEDEAPFNINDYLIYHYESPQFVPVTHLEESEDLEEAENLEKAGSSSSSGEYTYIEEKSTSNPV